MFLAAAVQRPIPITLVRRRQLTTAATTNAAASPGAAAAASTNATDGLTGSVCIRHPVGNARIKRFAREQSFLVRQFVGYTDRIFERQSVLKQQQIQSERHSISSQDQLTERNLGKRDCPSSKSKQSESGSSSEGTSTKSHHHSSPSSSGSEPSATPKSDKRRIIT